MRPFALWQIGVANRHGHSALDDDFLLLDDFLDAWTLLDDRNDINVQRQISVQLAVSVADVTLVQAGVVNTRLVQHEGDDVFTLLDFLDVQLQIVLVDNDVVIFRPNDLQFLGRTLGGDVATHRNDLVDFLDFWLRQKNWSQLGHLLFFVVDVEVEIGTGVAELVLQDALEDIAVELLRVRDDQADLKRVRLLFAARFDSAAREIVAVDDLRDGLVLLDLLGSVFSRWRDVDLGDALEPGDFGLGLRAALAQHLDLGAVGQRRDLRLAGESGRETGGILGVIRIA